MNAIARDRGSACDAGGSYGCSTYLFLTLALAFTLLGNTGARAEVLSREIRSLHQAGVTLLRTLVPQKTGADRTYPLVLVLPVSHVSNERDLANQYGDGLVEIEKLDLHNQHDTIFAAPSFTEVSWYCDHPTKTDAAQEAHLMEVIADIERNYPVSKNPEDRHLLGFSKSGWGAWSLLLRHPHRFGKAAAWDSPMMMTTIGKWDTDRTCGTQSAFERYLPSKLVREQGQTLGTNPRLILLGYGLFRDDHKRMYNLLNELRVPHVYRDGPSRKHDWRSGWLAEAVAQLLRR
jgi:Putative esterase